MNNGDLTMNNANTANASLLQSKGVNMPSTNVVAPKLSF